MSTVLAIANQKGGVGKTTTTLNLGAALVEQGKKVLLIDFDPQAALTVAYGILPNELTQTIYEVLVEQTMDLREVIISPHTGPDLAPANLNLAGAEVELLNEIGRELFLKEKLRTVRSQYDFILIDCPPSLGLLTINALSAADKVLIPIQTEYFALKALEHLLNIVRKIKAKANPGLAIAGILPTMYQARARHSEEVAEELRRSFGEWVLDAVIKKTVRFPDSVVVAEEELGEPPEPRSIFRFDPRSEYADAYRKLAKEIQQ